MTAVVVTGAILIGFALIGYALWSMVRRHRERSDWNPLGRDRAARMSLLGTSRASTASATSASAGRGARAPEDAATTCTAIVTRDALTNRIARSRAGHGEGR